MKQLRHVLSLTLAVLMVLGMVTPMLAASYELSVENDYEIPVESEDDSGFYLDVVSENDEDELSVLPKEDYETDDTADTNDEGSVTYSMSIVHVDCGRKYFTVSELEQIIDNAANAGFNYVELAVGNDGLRFLLNDMSISVNDTTYSSKTVSDAIHTGNETYANFDVDELTQSEMDTIITYANSKNISIIPLINTPGHMDAILNAAEACLTGETCSYNGSDRTIDVTNETVVAFTQALLQKYISYFADKGCKYFNIGADEYANDKYSTGGMGFGNLKSNNKYGYFIKYVNEVAKMVEDAKMTPMAFNDGIEYDNTLSADVGNTTYTFDKNIVICYWSNGWSGYTLRLASDLASDGFKLVNTNGSYYWVLGKSDDQCTVDEAKSFNYLAFADGNTVAKANVKGAMFCIWCDYPSADTAANVITATADVIEAFGGTLPAVTSDDSGSNDGSAENTVEVSVQVDGTSTYTFDNVNYENDVDESVLDKDIATYDINGVDSSETTTTTYSLGDKLTEATNDAKCVIYNGTYYVKLNGTSVEATTDFDEASVFNITATTVGGYTQIKLKSGDYYLTCTVSGKKYTLTADTEAGAYGVWQYSSSNGIHMYSGNSSYYIRYTSSGGWTVGSGTDKRAYFYGRKETTTTVSTPASTTVTFTGKATGNTQLKVGNTLFKITVLAQIETIDIEYWITNSNTPNGTKAGGNVYHLTNAYSGITTEDGVALVDIVDASCTRDNRTLYYWKNILLNKTYEEQTGDSGDDETFSGTQFTKIRYYNGGWQVYSVDGQWLDVDTTNNQLVTYYLEYIDIANLNGTSELKVGAADWGTRGDGSSTWGYIPESSRCSVSIQLVYEDGTGNPSATTADGLRTKTIVYGYWSAGRGIGTLMFDGQGDYQIYKVTATTGTMVSSTSNSNITATNGVYVTSLEWEDNEETVWEGDLTQTVSVHNNARNPLYDAPYDNLAWNTSDYNNNNAILIRVYVKAVAKEDSLTVHYIDKTTNTEFYNYSIPVVDGTEFDSAFGTNITTEDPYGLKNNSVINYAGQTQTINGDIRQLPQVSAQYRYSKFTLDDAKVTATGGINKDAYLYYTFTNVHNFVIDFGTTLVLNPKDITSATSGWTDADFADDKGCVDTDLEDGTVLHTKAFKYGTATIAKNQSLTYTATSPLQGVEQVAIKIIDGTAENTNVESTDNYATHYINIYPATNVLYEETVVTEQNLLGITEPANTWEMVGTSNVGNQQLEALDNDGTATNVYGYDDIYSEDTGFSGDTYYKATLTATDMQAATDTALSFTFTGTGFDLISECGPKTGSILVRLSTLNDNGTKTLIKGYFVDTYFVGDGTIINSDNADEFGVLDYQVPVVRDLDLAYDTYAVDIYGYVYPKTTASTNSVGKMISTESIVSEALDTLGLSDDVEMYEISYMDENSILNGGTGMSETAVVKEVYESDVISDNMMNAYMYEDVADEKNEAAATTGYVYIDGVRVYGTMNTTLDKDGGYKADERGTKYYNVYDFVNQSAQDFTNETDFMMYVEYDGNGNYVIQDYKNQGPENEIYLTDGHGVAFILDGYSGNVGSETVQLAMKVVKGAAGTVNFSVSDEDADESVTVHTNTEMYYKASVRSSPINGETVKYVLLTVSADEGVVISISGLKVSSCITPVANVELANEVIKYNSDTSDFTPDTFTVKNVKSVKSGKYFSVSVSTSTDANKVEVIVNGTTYELVPNNMTAVTSGTAKCYKYSKTIQAPTGTSGDTFEVSVIACKADDNTVKSDPVTMTVTIK